MVNSRPDHKGCIPVHGNKERGIDPIRLRQLRIVPSPTEDPVEAFDVTRKGNLLIVEQIIRPVIPAAKRAAGPKLQAADPQLHGTALDAHRPIP